MREQEIIIVTRDCESMLIPSGAAMTIRQGTQVSITQALGGTFTVHVNGNLARVEGKDADALGLPVPESLIFGDDTDNMVTEDMIWDQLRTCYDPEIPVNIVELGLIYELEIEPLDEGGYHIYVTMTLTTIGCGMGPMLLQDVEKKISQLRNVKKVDVQLVFDPPWDQSMMTEAAQLQLGLL